ncbi:glyoxalase [Marinomonas sp. S3726]|uniref:VOC family protein n=1 Tax=Marinomonas sp. S3726 TaxID=579484 RepID=UPI0005FA732D|nr:VOC family protein [Marinomonas sp. S3726]KJZ13625.1 glyoxalase [Marinomonas sp. S3726]
MIDVDAMFPVMVINDLEAVKQFYEAVFGFTAVFYDSNFYLHLISPNKSIQLGFLLPNLVNQPEFLHPIMSTQGYVISLEVKDAALAYSEAKGMDLNIAMALKQEEWGQIHFMIQDPAGIHVDVVQHLAPAAN